MLQIAVTLLAILPLPAEERWVQLLSALTVLFWTGVRLLTAVSLFSLRSRFPLEEA